MWITCAILTPHVVSENDLRIEEPLRIVSSILYSVHIPLSNVKILYCDCLPQAFLTLAIKVGLRSVS